MAMAKPSNCGIRFLSAAVIILFFVTITLEGRYLVQERKKFSMKQARTLSHRQLIGSVPPSCRARCGKCHPCRPVQVAVQPGMVVPTEYYPIVWRCQCGNKLFLP